MRPEKTLTLHHAGDIRDSRIESAIVESRKRATQHCSDCYLIIVAKENRLGRQSTLSIATVLPLGRTSFHSEAL